MTHCLRPTPVYYPFSPSVSDSLLAKPQKVFFTFSAAVIHDLRLYGVIYSDKLYNYYCGCLHFSFTQGCLCVCMCVLLVNLSCCHMAVIYISPFLFTQREDLADVIHVRGCIHAVNLWMGDNVGATIGICCAVGFPQVQHLIYSCISFKSLFF